jgi:hypothetical protein
MLIYWKVTNYFMFDHIRAGWDQNQPDEKRVFGGESSGKGPGF